MLHQMLFYRYFNFDLEFLNLSYQCVRGNNKKGARSRLSNN